MTTSRKRSLTGIQPSGDVHLGNYLGMLKPALELQKDYDCLYFIADMHALTSTKDGAAIHRFSMDVVATWMALGLDTEKHCLYRQSEVPFVTEYTWYLTCFTGMGLLEKCHAYKDKVEAGLEVTHGLFAYPVLMAADIVMYSVDVVPVGKDQKQHVEVARDIAGAVNAVLKKDLIKLPTPLIREDVMLIPGLDGRKMSKSYGNYIPLFADEKTLRKKVLSVKTDSTPLEAPKTMKDSLLGQYMQLFATKAQYDDLESRLQKGGLGWGHAKEELFEIINSHVKAPRAEYEKLRADEKYLGQVLDRGAARASEIALPNLRALRAELGFRNRSA